MQEGGFSLPSGEGSLGCSQKNLQFISTQPILGMDVNLSELLDRLESGHLVALQCYVLLDLCIT